MNSTLHSQKAKRSAAQQAARNNKHSPRHTRTMSGMPGNIALADIAPSELPDGFTLGGGGAAGGGGGGIGSNNNNSSADQAAQQRDAHRQAILEQAMTPEALARLRRVKVGARATNIGRRSYFLGLTFLIATAELSSRWGRNRNAFAILEIPLLSQLSELASPNVSYESHRRRRLISSHQPSSSRVLHMHILSW